MSFFFVFWVVSARFQQLVLSIPLWWASQWLSAFSDISSASGSAISRPRGSPPSATTNTLAPTVLFCRGTFLLRTGTLLSLFSRAVLLPILSLLLDSSLCSSILPPFFFINLLSNVPRSRLSVLRVAHGNLFSHQEISPPMTLAYSPRLVLLPMCGSLLLLDCSCISHLMRSMENKRGEPEPAAHLEKCLIMVCYFICLENGSIVLRLNLL